MASRERNNDRLESRREAREVKGRIIRGNFFGPLRYAGAGAFLIVVALLLLSYIGDTDDPRADFLRVRPYVAFFYGCLIVIGSLTVFSVVLVRNRRMILGKDRLQFVGSFGRIFGQIPYDNIVQARMSIYMGVEIILDRINRSDTWWPGLGKDGEYTVTINAGLEADPTAIGIFIRDKLREYRLNRGLPEWEE